MLHTFVCAYIFSDAKHGEIFGWHIGLDASEQAFRVRVESDITKTNPTATDIQIVSNLVNIHVVRRIVQNYVRRFVLAEHQ